MSELERYSIHAHIQKYGIKTDDEEHTSIS